eukprot:8907722-Pyramimonas_sp.AAC.1
MGPWGAFLAPCAAGGLGPRARGRRRRTDLSHSAVCQAPRAVPGADPREAESGALLRAPGR